jgi:4-hydroxy-tetrahydrodipicolinate reductase
MKIALIGFGKMGHMIAHAAGIRGHTIVCSVDPYASDATCVTSDSGEMVRAVRASGAEGIIEFSHPSAVLKNIKNLIPSGIPLVVGTTGWLENLGEISSLVKQSGSSLLYSANFSVGVNLFYRMVSEAARIMAEFEEYDIAVFEAHHNQKADSPSGTGLEIAKRILASVPRKTNIVTDKFDRRPEPQDLHLASVRVGSVPGTHTVFFDSVADTIELTHTARSREGFANGAIRAIEWLCTVDNDNRSKKGVFTMVDVFAEL